MALRVYIYDKCSTCRNALKFLTDHQVKFETAPIRETPPTEKELRTMLRHLGGDLRRLFNTSGNDYKAMNMKERFPTLSEEEAFHLLTTHGNLVKRPFALSSTHGTVGFKPEEWERLFVR